MLISHKMLINFPGIVMFRNLDVATYFIYKIWYVHCMDQLSQEQKIKKSFESIPDRWSRSLKEAQ